jgi:hypothetical protein
MGMRIENELIVNATAKFHVTACTKKKKERV